MRCVPTKISQYAPTCYITKDFGRFKDYKIHISKNYIENKLSSTLIYITDKADKWLVSKLKYFEGGERKTLWSKNKDAMV